MVTPYLTQHSPPALVAALPPIEHISNEDGSGGYQSPCSAAARFTSTLSTPGWATATRDTGSIADLAHPLEADSTMPPSTAVAPPDSPEPAPRGTTGTRCAAAQRTAAWTSAVQVARTTARGLPPGSRAQSCA